MSGRAETTVQRLIRQQHERARSTVRAFQPKPPKERPTPPLDLAKHASDVRLEIEGGIGVEFGPYNRTLVESIVSRALYAEHLRALSGNP